MAVEGKCICSTWRKTGKGKKPHIQRMQAKIGQITLENIFLEDTLINAGMLSAKR
jgi:hypothetical protein